MPKPLERFLTAGDQSKWVFGTGLTAALAGGGLANAAVAGTAAVVAGPVVLAVGITLLAGAGVYCGYRTFFPKSRAKSHDKAVPLRELDHKFWSCHIYRVGVVGIKRSGKSEIKAKLRGHAAGERNTEQIETHVFEIDRLEKIFVAYMDGRGADSDERQQQFEIADQSEILIVVLDHNNEDGKIRLSNTRLEEHNDFLQQLRKYLGQRKSQNPLVKVFFVLNKRDLWTRAPKGEQTRLKNWLDEHVVEWKELSISFAEETLLASAQKDDDIALLHIKITQAAKAAVRRREP